MRLGLAKDEAVFDKELNRDTHNSHLCHFSSCCNLQQSFQESRALDFSRSSCRCRFKTLLKAEPDQRQLQGHLQRLHQDHPHGNKSKIRWFPPGMGETVLLSPSQAFARVTQTVHKAVHEAGLCHDHELEFPFVLSGVALMAHSITGVVVPAVAATRDVTESDIIRHVSDKVWDPFMVFGPFTAHCIRYDRGAVNQPLDGPWFDGGKEARAAGKASRWHDKPSRVSCLG